VPVRACVCVRERERNTSPEGGDNIGSGREYLYLLGWRLLLLNFLHIRRHLPSLFEEKQIHIKSVIAENFTFVLLSAIDKNNEKGTLRKRILRSYRKQYIYIWNKSIIFANVPFFQPSSQRTKKKRPFGFDLTTNFQNEIMISLRLRLASVLNYTPEIELIYSGMIIKHNAVIQIDKIHTLIINNFITSFNCILKKNSNMKFDNNNNNKKKERKMYVPVARSQSRTERERERERERGVKGFAREL
jgi:hypothetical protein